MQTSRGLATSLLAASALATLGLAAPALAAGPQQQIYIVQTRGEPAATYDGRVAGLAPTRPQEGHRIDAASQAVQDYLQYLSSSHARIAQEAGVRTISDYGVTLNGFAAEMTEAQAVRLSTRDDVVAVFPFRTYDLDTNNTYAFMGLNTPRGPWRRGKTGEDVVIGILDGGIWPEHPCFEDRRTPARGEIGRPRAYGPAPASFSGVGACEFGNTAFNPGDAPFTCNNKLLAARFYVDGFGPSGITADECLSARDCGSFGDHGTNVAGNAACNALTTAFPGGVDVGEIAGMAPRARLAHYKVCWTTPTAPNGTCANVDLIAAVEQAILDGVDVMNLSLGSDNPAIGDAFDIALLNATAAGIFVATSAGNAGPGPGTVGSPAAAPWVTAVGAMQDDAVTATGLDVQSPASIAGTKIGLEGAGPVTLAGTPDIVADVVVAAPLEACGALTNAAAMSGRIALVRRGTCGFNDKYLNAQAAGAQAIVVFNDGASPTRLDPIVMGGISSAVTIPGIMIGFADGSEIQSTLAGGTNVVGRLSSSIQERRGDRIATFSSRGPNGFTADVLKPDLVTPGVAILSAGSPLGGLDDDGLWSTLQGTSFSSPHMAGLFALLKQAHPGWSPAYARSAFMTTARQNIKETFREDLTTPFDIGGGMVEPAKALDPGLVYDTTTNDYAAYACGQNIVFDAATCATLASAGFSFDPAQMNYPSITAAAVVGQKVITRTVTNVSNRPQTWFARVEPPAGFDVTVSPSSIRLAPNASATFTVTLTTRPDATIGAYTFGALYWETRNPNRKGVRSPITARAERFDAPDAVSGTGAAGSTSFDVSFGYTGAYTAQVHGLDAATRTAASVLDDPANDINTALGSGVGVTVLTVSVPAFGAQGPAFARFALFDGDTDGNDDLDLYVFDPTGSFVGSSGTPTSNERVDVASPVPGTWFVAVHGFETDGPDANFTLSSWSFGFNDDRGNSSVSAPSSASVGTSAPVNYSWSGLAAATRYLGAVSHSDATGIIDLTLVDITTN